MMIFRLRNLVALILCGATAFLGWQTYTYFFDQQIPSIALLGISENSYYQGDIACSLNATKSGELTLWLDNQPLTRGYDGIRKNREYPFTIPTSTLNNGKHALKVQFVDGSYHKNKIAQEYTFFVDNLPLQASFVTTDAECRVLQGRTLHIQFQVNKEIEIATLTAFAEKYPCFPESKNSLIYECFVPISCEENANESLFTAEINDKVGNTINLENKLSVILCPFKKQTITVSQEKVDEEKELGDSQQELEIALKELTLQSPHEKLWRGQFCLPIEISRITCDFGTIRTTQTKGRYIHRALDLINTPKSVVWATQNGTIALTGRYALSGNTVIIDHGWGILSLFFHLDSIADLNVGQKIAKGNPIGTLGKTGYATGYHLHWEMRVNNMPIDPVQWTKQIF